MTVINRGLAYVGSNNNYPNQLKYEAKSALPPVTQHFPSADSEVSRVAADADLAKQYGEALLTGKPIEVPAKSSLGRWIEVLRVLVESPVFKQLLALVGEANGAFTIDRTKGEILFASGKKLTSSSPELANVVGGKEIFDNFISTAKIVFPYDIVYSHKAFETGASGGTQVDQSTIQHFYGEPSLRSSEHKKERAKELANRPIFNGQGALPDDRKRAEILRTAGDANTMVNLLNALKQQSKTPNAKSNLEAIFVTVAPHSELWSEEQKQPVRMSVQQLLTHYGLQAPTTPEEVENLERALSAPPLVAPPEGNFGGLLGKTVPLSKETQEQINATVGDWKSQQTPPPGGAPEQGTTLVSYLARWVPNAVTIQTSQDPQAYIQALISTPQARALGKQLQVAIGALDTPSSVQEVLLAALGLEADPNGGQQRDNLAGYNLRQPDNWKRPPAEIVRRFEAHLASRFGPAAARVKAFQLLAMSSPEFLVKGIPSSMVYGSVQWAAFSAAVTRRELDTPGSSAGQSYDEIMARDAHEPITEGDQHHSQIAAAQSLIDWGIANGVIEEDSEGNYSPETIQRAAAAQQKQVNAIIDFTEVFASPMPTRRELAIAELTRVYGAEKAHLFDKPAFRRIGVTFRDTQKYSLLDIYMSGELHSFRWVSEGRNGLSFRQFQKLFGALSNIEKKLDEAFDKYTQNMSKAAGANYQYQVSQLPLEDRHRFERGRVGMEYLEPTESSNFPTGSEEHPIFKLFGQGAFLIHTQLNGDRVDYVYSPALGKIIKVGERLPGVPEGWDINVSERKKNGWTRTRHHLIVGGEHYELNMRANSGKTFEALPPPHPKLRTDAASARTGEISEAITSIYADAVNQFKAAARGMTEREKSKARSAFLENFLLGFIPGYKFIKAIIDGDKYEAVIAGLFDLIGLLAPPLKGGFQALRAGAKGVSAIAGFLKGFARGGVKGLNTFGSFYDAGKGVFKLGKTVLKTMPNLKSSVIYFGSARHLTGQSGSRHVPLGEYKQIVAEGTYRSPGTGGKDVPVVAVQRDGKWYAFDTHTKAPYGPELKDFKPSIAQGVRNPTSNVEPSVNTYAEHQAIQTS